MNLVIGRTSQLAQYFPEDYVKISSRNISIPSLEEFSYESVYICFAEQNMIDDNVDFITPNFILTKEIIETLEKRAKKIVIYTTCELWNQLIGPINIDTPFNYKYKNDYCYSKELLFNWVIKERQKGKLKNVIVLHPFNFNSIHRNENYIFGKVFDSIINKKRITIGNTYFHRDIIHTKYMVERSIGAKNDEIVGSGRLTHINSFIRDLYNNFGMKYDDWVTEDLTNPPYDRFFYSKQTKIYSYQELMRDTVEDIETE